MSVFKIVFALMVSMSMVTTVAPVAAQDDNDESTAVTRGVNHIGFAVSDLDASAAFFIETLGWECPAPKLSTIFC